MYPTLAISGIIADACADLHTAGSGVLQVCRCSAFMRWQACLLIASPLLASGLVRLQSRRSVSCNACVSKCVQVDTNMQKATFRSSYSWCWVAATAALAAAAGPHCYCHLHQRRRLLQGQAPPGSALKAPPCRRFRLHHRCRCC
jgi:hypothetical protein